MPSARDMDREKAGHYGKVMVLQNLCRASDVFGFDIPSQIHSDTHSLGHVLFS